MTVMKRYIIPILLGFLAFSLSGMSQTSRIENKVLRAVEKYNVNDIDSAKKILNSVLSEDETCDAAWYYRAMIAIQENQIDLAQEYLKRAVDLDPQNFWYRYRLSTLYAFTNQEELAIDILENLMEDFPKKSELYFDMVDLYVEQENFEKALKTIDEIEREFGQTESMILQSYRILRHLKRETEAVERLHQYNSKYSSPYVLCILAEEEMHHYNDSTALGYYNEALDMDPSFSPALLGKAEVFRMTFRYDDYFATLSKYIESPDATASSKADYLKALIEQGNVKLLNTYRAQMDSIVNRFAEVHSKEEAAYEAPALYYFYTQRFDKAKQFFVEYMAEYPESYEAAAALVEFLMYMKDWDDLSLVGRAAYIRFPEEPAFLEMACVGDYSLNNYDKALEACSELLKVQGDDPQKKVRTLSTMGDVYYQQGDKKNAFKVYESALKIDPANVYILNNYAYYLSLEGRNLNKAYEMSKKTVEAEPDNATYLDTFGWILYLQGKSIEARPGFKNAMLHGGKESAVILDHYADVLFSLGEYDMAFIYWNLALQKENGNVPGLKAKVEAKRKEVKK